MKKILIVDDEQISITKLTELLSDCGIHDIKSATTGRACLDILNVDSDFDLITTNLVMPNIDGLELIEHLNKLHPNIPILVISGIANLHNELLNLGIKNFILKPVLLPKLQEELNAIFSES